MTRNVQRQVRKLRRKGLLPVTLLLGLALVAPTSFATVDSPVVQGLGGAGRSGVAREALFSNPAAVASLSTTFGFFHYEIPKIADFNAGGRSLSVGLYDGGDKTWKGGFGYSRTSKARIFQGRQGYVDRSEFRFATGHALYNDLVGGLAVRRIKNVSSKDSDSFFEGDVGVLLPLYGDLRGGATFENALNREDELPQTVGVGAAYALGSGIQVLADGYRLMSGTRNGERGWSLAAEIGLAADTAIRGGLFEEAYRGLKGWSLGASWSGPRMSFDYAMKSTGSGPKEKSHLLGVTLMM